MTLSIPETYRLYQIAQSIAQRMNLDLVPAVGRDKELYSAVLSFANSTDHLRRCALDRGRCENEIVLIAERGIENLIHYSGALSTSRGKPIETLYTNNSRKRISITWGYPEDTGVLEVADIRGSIAIQQLSGVERGMGGRSSVIYNSEAPQPRSYSGVAQFRADDWDKLYHTIETLLD